VGVRKSKDGKTVFTYIHTHIHTYRDYLSLDGRGRKDSDGSYISHRTLALHVALPHATD
jgi:hypothetical protein